MDWNEENETQVRMTSTTTSNLNLSHSEMSPLEARVYQLQRERDRRWAVRLSRLGGIVRHYRIAQLAERAMNVIGKRLGVRRDRVDTIELEETPSLRASSKDDFCLLVQVRASHCYVNADDRRSELQSGRVTLLNIQRPLNWIREADVPLLWQFQLHYHEYLLPFATSTNSADIELVEGILRSWLHSNPPTGAGVHESAWHPYCISRRLPVWFGLLTNSSLTAELHEALIKSAYLQTLHLAKHLEWGLGGNHLLENLRALALAAAFFDTRDSTNWLNDVARFLPKQLEEQTLEHGEHFERSPMYHCQVLGDVMEAAIVMRSVQSQLSESLKTYAKRMMEFLETIVHPDGEIPLLGDSCFGEAPSVACLNDLFACLGLVRTSPVFEHHDDVKVPNKPTNIGQVSECGPYWKFRGKSLHVLFDRGAVGADPLPAHAHCDLLGIEVSLHGRRLIVDSGVFNYEDDSMRWFCRSTSAHNVVSIEDKEQCEVWSKFRMGYRGTTSNLIAGETDGYCWSSASHDAYRRLGIDQVARLVAVSHDERLFCLERTHGAESQSCIGRLHLAPEVLAEKISKLAYKLSLGKDSVIVQFIGVSEVVATWGWYCSEFGFRERRNVLEYHYQTSSKQIAGWQLFDFSDDRVETDEAISKTFFNVEVDRSRLELTDSIGHKRLTLPWQL